MKTEISLQLYFNAIAFVCENVAKEFDCVKKKHVLKISSRFLTRAFQNAEWINFKIFIIVHNFRTSRSSIKCKYVIIITNDKQIDPLFKTWNTQMSKVELDIRSTFGIDIPGKYWKTSNNATITQKQKNFKMPRMWSWNGNGNGNGLGNGNGNGNGTTDDDGDGWTDRCAGRHKQFIRRAFHICRTCQAATW